MPCISILTHARASHLLYSLGCNALGIRFEAMSAMQSRDCSSTSGPGRLFKDLKHSAVLSHLNFPDDQTSVNGKQR